MQRIFLVRTLFIYIKGIFSPAEKCSVINLPIGLIVEAEASYLIKMCYVP